MQTTTTHPSPRLIGIQPFNSKVWRSAKIKSSIFSQVLITGQISSHSIMRYLLAFTVLRRMKGPTRVSYFSITLCINDVIHAITSQIKLFAVCVLYKNIFNQNDHLFLQGDLDTSSSWAEKCLMEPYMNKCVVLSITLKHNYSFHDYNILDTTLKWVANRDYLGVTISSDLNYLDYVTNISNKDSRTLGLL